MPRALVAGGGIAGVAAALALVRNGWGVTVCETRPELGEIGAGLQMSPNAVRVLEWLDVLDAVRSTAFVPHAAVLRDGVNGTEIYRAALGGEAAERWGAPYLHVHRADLLSVLLDAAQNAGVEVRLDAPAVAAVEQHSGISLHLENGEVLPGDLVIGADGIGSALRRGINPDETPRFTGQVAWRALVDAAAVPKGAIPPDATVWAGPGQHLVTYYLRGGTLINLVAVSEQAEWAEESWSVPGDPDALRAAFAGWHPDLRQLLEQVDECYLWSLCDRPEQVRWTKGRLALIGDAAHPMLPFMAQGAAQALEDVGALVRHLKDGVPQGLRAWEEERWPRVTRVLQTAEANGRMFHRAPGLLRALSRAFIGTVSRAAPGVAAGQLDWLYGFDAVKGPARP